MENFKIFLVEDDDWYSQILNYQSTLNPELETHVFKSGKDCLNHMYLNPDLIAIDYNLSDISGDLLFSKIQEIDPSIAVIFIAAKQDLNIAVELLKRGVTDYVVKEESTKDLLWRSIMRVREKFELKSEIFHLKHELSDRFIDKSVLLGGDEEIKKANENIAKAAQTNIKVSISGETGTGKELVAKAIHYNSLKASNRFVSINLANIPKDLHEDELFGHEAGSATGAINSKIGCFEEANNGTLFINEITEMDLQLQSTVIKVLQDREFRRIGGDQIYKFNLRLITGTQKDLLEEVKKGNLMEDLYYRILGFPIAIPPLRNRKGDIMVLARHFVDEFCNANGISSPSFAPSAVKALVNYSFPGNMRELKSICELASVMCGDGDITDIDIQLTSPNTSLVMKNTEKTMKEYMQEIISYYLAKNKNNVVKAAKALKIGKSTIYDMIKSKELNAKQP